MSHLPLQVLYEDNHLLAVSKPAGLPTMGVAPDRDSLLTIAKRYLKQKYHKPGNVYLGIVSRLDAPVTGVVLMARTSKAASRLSEQFRQRDVHKCYWALVQRAPQPPRGSWTDWLRKDERHRKVLICDPDTADAQQAILSYRILERVPGAVQLEIELETGRKHQIRVQLAARRLPVLGDRKYGSQQPFEPGIALHSRELRFTHPVQQNALRLVAPVPASWKPFLRRIG